MLNATDTLFARVYNALQSCLKTDAERTVARAILAHGNAGTLPANTIIITAPTLRVDGSVFDRPGFDAGSGLLYFCEQENPPRVPEFPTGQAAMHALRFLWTPLAQFPMESAADNATVLHGLITAALRASLPRAPGVGISANRPGAGKTLLACCIAALATRTVMFDGLGDPADSFIGAAVVSDGIRGTTALRTCKRGRCRARCKS